MTEFNERTGDGSKRDAFVDRESALQASMPSQEKNQPDPMLQITTGRMGAGGIAVVAIAAAVILGFVLYGLNGGSAAQQTAAAPPPHAMAPAAGGHGGPPNTSGPRANESGAKG